MTRRVFGVPYRYRYRYRYMYMGGGGDELVVAGIGTWDCKVPTLMGVGPVS